MITSSVNVSVASIAAYLPSSRENDDALFSGTTSRPAAPPTMTPVQEARVRVEQIERQKRDAQARNVAWSADSVMGPDDVDAEGDPDPEYEPQVTVYDSNSLAGPLTIPYGVRDESGDIRPLGPGLYPGEQQYAGISEDIPTKLQGLVMLTYCLLGIASEHHCTRPVLQPYQIGRLQRNTNIDTNTRTSWCRVGRPPPRSSG